MLTYLPAFVVKKVSLTKIPEIQNFEILTKKFTELADSVWIILTNTVLSLYLEVLLHLIEALRHNEKSDTLYHFSPLKPTINSCGLA